MRFTKEQRHEIYQQARETPIDADGVNLAVCGRIANICYMRHDCFLIADEVPEYFPEFGAFEPKEKYEDERWFGLWWPPHDIKSRNACLDACIEQTKPELLNLQEPLK